MHDENEKSRSHRYTARVVWTGDRGEGTAAYARYGREHRIVIDGKPDLLGSADAVFHGDANRHNPEDLFVASIAACHMLVYLGLCARRGLRVVAYEDEPLGTLALDAEGGRFVDVTLAPTVTIADGDDERLALELHDAAHRRCFIANSCSVPIRHRPTVRTAAAATAAASAPRATHPAQRVGGSARPTTERSTP